MTLGLCSQIDLDAEVKKAAAKLERERKEAGIAEPPKAGTLVPTEETIAAASPPEPEPERPMATALAQEARDRRAAPDEKEEAPDVDSVFARLKDLKRTDAASD